MELSEVNQIWNRAALEFGGDDPRDGDRALADLLLAHGMTMNGGVGHALEVLSSDELSAAISGYRFFGFDDIAELLEKSVNATEEELDRADFIYGELIPDDETLSESFEFLYKSSSEVFAPL